MKGNQFKFWIEKSMVYLPRISSWLKYSGGIMPLRKRIGRVRLRRRKYFHIFSRYIEFRD